MAIFAIFGLSDRCIFDNFQKNVHKYGLPIPIPLKLIDVIQWAIAKKFRKKQQLWVTS